MTKLKQGTGVIFTIFTAMHPEHFSDHRQQILFLKMDTYLNSRQFSEMSTTSLYNYSISSVKVVVQVSAITEEAQMQKNHVTSKCLWRRPITEM